jgi:hypothetical protein
MVIEVLFNNKIQIIFFELTLHFKNYLHNNWGGLVVKELNSIFHVRGSNFTNDMCCGKTLEYWQNIPYLHRLHRLGGNMCQQLIGSNIF